MPKIKSQPTDPNTKHEVMNIRVLWRNGLYFAEARSFDAVVWVWAEDTDGEGFCNPSEAVNAAVKLAERHALDRVLDKAIRADIEED